MLVSRLSVSIWSYPSAIEAYQGVLETRPENLQARLYLGNALLRSGRERAAAEEYRRFLDLHDTGEDAERVRRILRQIAPDLLPEEEERIPEEEAPAEDDAPGDPAQEPTS